MSALETPLPVTRTVREFLFDGYPDPLLDLAAFVPDGILPSPIPYDKFGWFYTRNGSDKYDGVFNMYTGNGDITKFGQIGNWNYKNQSSAFKSDCGVLNGSAGEFFQTHPEKGGTITLFSPDICRTITLNYKEENAVEGIKAYRYWGDKNVFDNFTRKPENWCYCPEEEECPPHGVVDVSSCKLGAPVFLSFPHFFHADQYFQDSVDGMKPNESLHQMYIDLEQNTGIPVQVAATLQINVLLEPFPEYKLLKSLPKLYFPVFWFKEEARIDEKLGPQVWLVSKIPMAGCILFWFSIGVGGIILITVAIVYYSCCKNRKSVKTEIRLIKSIDEAKIQRKISFQSRLMRFE